MCFGPIYSITAFIIGTVINIVVTIVLLQYWNGKYAYIIPFAIASQFALLMQVIEYYIWTLHNRKEPITQQIIETTFWLNMLQPVFLFIMGLVSRKMTHTLEIEHIVAFVLITCIYIYFLVYLLRSKKWNIEPTPECKHVRLSWLENREEPGHYVYLIVILIAIFMAPSQITLPLCFIILSTAYLSWLIYPCSTGSVWCFSVVIMSPLLVALHQISN